MKLFVSDESVYFMKEETLYKSQINRYGFCDLDQGQLVDENQEHMNRIAKLLVTVSEVAYDVDQLLLF
jgi:hypothetical protein